MINTTVFKNLKLVVNFTRNLNDYIQDTSASTGSNPPFGSVQPFLLYDEMLGDPVPVQNFNFNTIEHDRFIVPDINGNVSDTNQKNRQSVTNKLSGFDNKSVKRMLMVKTPQLATTYQSAVGINTQYGPMGSKAFFNESLQVRVNGSAMFAGNGLTKDNQRLAMLTDVWGHASAYPFASGQAQINDINTDNERAQLLQNGNTVISELDYIGVNVNSEISDLQIEFGRDALWVVDDTGGAGIGSQATTNGASINQQFFMNCFAEVGRSILFQPDGSYLVVYA